MSYLGNAPGVESQRLTTTLTATASQTDFNPVGGYTLGYVDVYLNGVKLVEGADYTAADGVSVVLASGAAVNDLVEIVTYTPRGLSDGYTKAEADARYVNVSGDTMTGALAITADLTVDTDTFYVDSTNHGVGIGTTSVDSVGNFTSLILQGNSTTEGGLLRFYNSDRSTMGQIYNTDTAFNVVAETGLPLQLISDGGTGASIYLSTENNIRMGASYVYVGGTYDTSLYDNGAAGNTGTMIEPDGSIQLTKSNNFAMYLNRIDGSGGIISLRENGAGIGNIGTAAQRPFIAASLNSTDAGIRFTDVQVNPCNADGTEVDNAVDLGSPTANFRDIFFAGEIRNATKAGEATQTIVGAVTGVSNGFDLSTFSDNTSSLTYTNSSGTCFHINAGGHTLAYQGLSVAEAGAAHDTFTYGTAGVTRTSAGSSGGFGKVYHALTRAGQFVWGTGVDDSNRYVISTPNTSAEFPNDTPPFCINTSGNIGIGGYGGAYKLIVKGGASDSAIRVYDGSNYLTMGQWDGSNNRIESSGGRDLFFTSYNTTAIKFGRNGTADTMILTGGALTKLGNGLTVGYNGYPDSGALLSLSCFADNATVTSGRVNITTSASEWQPGGFRIRGTSVGSGLQGLSAAWWEYKFATYNGSIAYLYLIDSGGDTGSFTIQITSTYVSSTNVQIDITMIGPQNRTVGMIETLSYAPINFTERTG